MSVERVLQQLRWKEDMHIINHFGEHVYLRGCFSEGKKIGITECCNYESPCGWHSAIKATFQRDLNK